MNISNFPNSFMRIKEVKACCCICLHSLPEIIMSMTLPSFCEGAIDPKTILLQTLKTAPIQKISYSASQVQSDKGLRIYLNTLNNLIPVTIY